ncbi:DUF2254 domain-containing protein [Okeanomitos corallinicola TIOX110]|uniref:DUF2254 domain-containing protein n=1 Tax=Okeanomitos corallinicola TIOX110 TaxID=3133117 RepID=A0ABZ2UVL5_9CYAN
MKNIKLNKLWDALHSSYWFLPSVMVTLGICLVIIMLFIDHQVNFSSIGLIYSGDAEGARGVLSVIASSMVSVTATAFSITIVALQLASRNFGPRLLRNFMRDTGNQIVLGSFLSTFIYSLLILRSIYDKEDDLFIPNLSITVGILLSLVSIGVLIYFIHHASTIIQSSHVLESVSQDLYESINRLFPEKIGHDQKYIQHNSINSDRDINIDFNSQSFPVTANKNGYLQLIDDDRLIKIARDYQIIIYIQAKPGEFIISDSVLAVVFPADKVNHKLSTIIQKIFILGKERTNQQDIEFPILQLVEIALRAISPAVNDPFTAIYVIDRLCAGLCQLVQREFPSACRYDQDHKLRVIVKPVSFAKLLNDAFEQIRQNLHSQTAVTIHLLEAIATIASFTQNSHYHALLRHHADMIKNSSQKSLPASEDFKNVQQSYDCVIQTLSENL